MIEMLYSVILLFLGVTLIFLFSLLIKVLSQGPSEITKLRQLGFGFVEYFSGSLPKPQGGANIKTIEGLELLSENGRISKVRETRTLSDEID